MHKRPDRRVASYGYEEPHFQSVYLNQRRPVPEHGVSLPDGR